MPLAFMFVDSVLLLVAVIRVWRMFREEGVSVNEKYMAAHCALLFLLLGFQLFSSGFGLVLHVTNWFALWTCYHVGIFFVSLLMCFIMW